MPRCPVLLWFRVVQASQGIPRHIKADFLGGRYLQDQQV
jgi:hypothetical protein